MTPIKCIYMKLRQIRDDSRYKKRGQVERMCLHGLGRSHIAPGSSPSLSALVPASDWANLPPELLINIVQRVEATQTFWPARRDVVACAAVSKSWREAAKEVVKTPEQSLSGDAGKLLLTAKRIVRATSIEFLISLASNDFSRATNTYVGKLRGPRRMACTMHSIPLSAVEERGTAPTFGNRLEEQCLPLSVSKGKNLVHFASSGHAKSLDSVQNIRAPLLLENKAPRWHEQLQCWCLNFKGRVTGASIKNFQLVASGEPCQNIPVAEQEKVILQFGKIGKDIFTIDYRYPLSAFQAFAICLSSFDPKPLCE